MLYIYMLGYDVDFGHMEAVSLISAPKYPEKQVSPSLSIIFYFIFFVVSNRNIIKSVSHLQVHKKYIRENT
jgi:hypothetical protein